MEKLDIIWEKLEQALRKAGIFLASRLAAEKFKERHEAGMGSIRFDAEGQIIACCFLWETGLPGLVELGTIWVHERHRGQRLSEQVFADCLEITQDRGLKAFMVTCNGRVADLALRAGWNEDSRGSFKVLRTILAAINHQTIDGEFIKSNPESNSEDKRLFRSW